MQYEIEADITRAATLPGAFYVDATAYERLRERVFARSWQLVGDLQRAPEPQTTWPFTFLPGCVEEPLVLTRTAGGASHVLSNVCTHRANLVCVEAGRAEGLRCRYHGRRFTLDGRFVSMPEFDAAREFPSGADHLPRVQHGALGPLLFAAIDPHPLVSLDELLAPLRARLEGLPLDRLVYDAQSSRDYDVAANWALYLDNFLEGFHIPFVHPGLNGVIDFGAYVTELSSWGSLQIGVAKDGEPAFEQLDAGRRVAAYYFWLFPNTMLNVYPWGISVNVVQPRGVEAMRVCFRSYVWDATKRTVGAGTGLDQVEHEDEAVVLSVQSGVRARLYSRGRYSPSRESGVHHFHRLLTRYL
jgi:choline monooxygenase